MTVFGKGFAALQLDHPANSRRHETLTGSAASTAAVLRELPERYAAGVRASGDRLRQIDTDTSLSDAGKAAAHTTAHEGWQRVMEKMIGDAQRQATSARRNRENRILPAPLHIDPGVAQARLANARSDARMLLDPVKPTDLRTQLEQLVGPDANPAVRHLLLVGNWPELYTASRNVPGIGLEWTRGRCAYLASLLGADGKTALAELEGLADALEVAPSVAALFEADAAAHGLRLDAA